MVDVSRLRDRKSCEDLPTRPISWMFFCQAKLRWCGYVEKMNKENPVNNCRFIEVGGGGGREEKVDNAKHRPNWLMMV